MAPSSKSEKDGNKLNMQRKHHQNNNSVVKLVTRGKLSGQFCQSHFMALPHLVTIPLRDIVSEQFHTEGHVCLGFTKRGRYILTYTEREGRIFLGYPVEYIYVLYWWEFDLHRKLKLVREVELDMQKCRDTYLSVCEWPTDDSKLVVFNFNSHCSSTSTDQHHRLMNMVPNNEWDSCRCRCVFGITIVSNPPSEPCPHCSPNHDRGVGECLEHGYVLYCLHTTESPYAFQPALQLKMDKILLLKSTVRLEACCVYLCPAAGEKSRSSQMLFTKRADESLSKPWYLKYTRRYYRLPQPGAAGQEDEEDQDAGEDDENDVVPLLPQLGVVAEAQDDDDYHNNIDDRCHPFSFRDLQGRELESVTGPREDRQTLCVEQLTLNIKDFIHDWICNVRNDLQLDPIDTLYYYNNGTFAYDVVILEACPETNTVVMDVGWFILSSKDQRQCGLQTSLQVRWELDTGLCFVDGIGDHAKVDGHLSHSCGSCTSTWRSCRHSVSTVMEVLAPENGSHLVNVMTNEALPGGVLADADRCTRVVL